MRTPSLATRIGLLAFAALLALYFVVLTAISGWQFAVGEFSRYWFYILPLAAGFGLQVTLFMALRLHVARSAASGTVVAASGTTSTVAMISCCAHYLTTVAPVLGATGLVAFAAQFQVQFFWLGLLLNAAGIAFVASRLARARRAHAQCATA